MANGVSVRGCVDMKLGDMTDESLLAYYESIRRQVAADQQLGGRYRLAGGTVREYTGHLQDEIRLRQTDRLAPKFLTASSGIVDGMSDVQIGPGATAFTLMSFAASIWASPPREILDRAFVA
jgi:hypothetical protein